MTSYKLITSIIPTEVEDRVNAHLQAGFVLCGPIVVSHDCKGPTRYTQAMTYTAPAQPEQGLNNDD